MQWLMYHFHLLHTLAPATNDHTSALRVSISVAAPSLVLLASGYPELIIYAVCGALTGMYGRSEHHQLRLCHQAQAALLLVAGVGVGVFLSVNGLHSWWLVGVEALVAAAGSIYSDRVKLKPDGPFFGILALGACASIPTTVPWITAVFISAISAAISIVVGFGGWIRGRVWQPGAVRNTAPLKGARRKTVLVQAGRYALAVGGAGAAGVLSGSGYPHWAMAAAAVPLAGADLPSGVYRGLHRVVGTCLGLIIVAVLTLPGPWILFPVVEATAMVMLIIVFQFTTELLMTRHYGLAMVSFTPVILLITQLAAPEEPHLLISERGTETFIGAAIGIAVILVSRRPAPQSEEAMPNRLPGPR